MRWIRTVWINCTAPMGVEMLNACSLPTFANEGPLAITPLGH